MLNRSAAVLDTVHGALGIRMPVAAVAAALVQAAFVKKVLAPARRNRTIQLYTLLQSS
jgi:hypothetical protein